MKNKELIMQNSQHNGSLKDKFQDFGAAPSESLWGDIAGVLDKKKKKRVIIWWWFGGIAATILLSFSMYKIGFDKGAKTVQNEVNYTEEKIVSDVDEDGVLSDNNTSFLEIQEEGNSNEVDSSSYEFNLDKNENQNNGNSIKVPLVNPTEFLLTLSTVNNLMLNAPVVYEPAEQDVVIDMMEYNAINKIPNRKQIDNWDGDNDSLPEIEHKEEYKWNIGFNASAMESMDWGVQYAMIQPTTVADVNNNSELVDNSGIATLESFASPALTIVEKWVSPVYSLDFTANKYFSKRFAFSTGGHLSFRQFTTQYDMFDIQYAKTRVFSLGIPVGLKFDMIHRDNFRFYMRGSVLNEVPLIENIKVSNYSSFSKSTNLTLGYMGSGQFDSGVEWRMANGIFLNMNLSYRRYFVQSMKSEHPLARRNHWLGGSIGLVWEL